MYYVYYIYIYIYIYICIELLRQNTLSQGPLSPKAPIPPSWNPPLTCTAACVCVCVCVLARACACACVLGGWMDTCVDG